MHLLIMAMLLADPQPEVKATNQIIVVEGRTYRVRVKDRTFAVYNKAVFTKSSPEEGARMRTAVLAVTGCSVRDGYFDGAHLTGLLDCRK